jgi:UDP-N-acetylmuramoyl-L-alanyl-D-glutamate--2,6-diaminopimelate ligase
MNASHTTSAPRWRPLKALLGGGIEVRADVEVSDLTLDSRAVRPGAAFLACRGRKQHGLVYARDAVAGGARAILWEPAPGVTPPSLDTSVLLVAVPQLSAQAGFIADRFFDAPSAKLAVAGVTGTNGKTTCAWLLAQALGNCGLPAAYFGTLGMGRIGALRDTAHTTPDAVSLQRHLAIERDAGTRAVAMEVSSHALDQQRCAGVRFQAAAFTNLSREHLDYHGDMTAYAAAKRSLFDWPTLAARVINVDDACGAELATQLRGRTGLLLTARQRTDIAGAAGRYVCAAHFEATADGLQLELQTSWGNALLRSGLIGEFNVDNLLTVMALLLALEVPLASACAALAQCTAPPGRMETLGGGALPLVIIDYAHTPDALSKALAAARSHATGKLWCVFGCGGERDMGKRPVMGGIAARLADHVIVTDDNPRSEDPAAIAAAIIAGADGTASVAVIHDRAAAIGDALSRSAPGDVVLVAGKGHELFQIIGDQRHPFVDRSVVDSALRARRRDPEGERP